MPGDQEDRDACAGFLLPVQAGRIPRRPRLGRCGSEWSYASRCSRRQANRTSDKRTGLPAISGMAGRLRQSHRRMGRRSRHGCPTFRESSSKLVLLDYRRRSGKAPAHLKEAGGVPGPPIGNCALAGLLPPLPRQRSLKWRLERAEGSSRRALRRKGDCADYAMALVSAGWRTAPARKTKQDVGRSISRILFDKADSYRASCIYPSLSVTSATPDDAIFCRFLRRREKTPPR